MTMTLCLIVSAFMILDRLRRIDAAVGSMLKKKPLFEEQEMDPLLNELMEYTFEKKMTCIMQPNHESKMSLYMLDGQTHYFITTLVTVREPVGSAAYNVVLQELKDKVDNFMENFIREKEKKNA